MEISAQVFNEVLVMMLLAAAGFICNRSGLLSDDSERPLSNLLLMVVLPALVIQSYQRDYRPELAKGLLIAFGLAVISHAVGIIISYIFIRKKGNAKNAGIERFSAIYSNCGFIAIPLIGAVIGSEGVFYAIAYVTVFNILSWTHGAFMISENRNFSSALKMLFSPMIISIAASMLMFFFNIKLPGVINETVGFIADLNTPLAMIVTGICISKAGIFKTLSCPRAYYVSFLRLILIPAATILLLKLLPVSYNIAMANIIASSCSSAVSVILFAGKYGKNSAYASQLVAISTILSLATIPLSVWFAQLILF